MAQTRHILVRTLLVAIVVVWAAADTARPVVHFDGPNQVGDQDPPNVDGGLGDLQSQWNLFRKLAQLAQMDRDEFVERGWERGVRSPENKRQSRYRQCYFNPVSCFRK